jgi:poly-gamma-glutamate capsule biosynthesis protein CapA/YwtB (metallophosphatase superfamily)
MGPQNVGCLTVARIDCCCWANNHALDGGHQELEETLQTLDAADLAHAGAGRNAAEAATPCILDCGEKGRVLVFAFGSPTSGIPSEWSAAENRPGVNLLEDRSADTVCRIVSPIHAVKRRGDTAIVSIHWGPNWGYEISNEQIAFTHCTCTSPNHSVSGIAYLR